MRRLSKFCAGALAFMLSAVLVLPITASANSVIDTNVKKITATGTYTSTIDGEDSEDIEEKAELAAWQDAIKKGAAIEGSALNYSRRFSSWDATAQKWNYTYFRFADENWSRYDYDYDTSNAGKTGTYSIVFQQRTYKNNITGEESSNIGDLTGAKTIEGANDIPKKFVVYTGGYDDIDITLDCGNVNIKNIKTSSKKTVTAKIVSKDVNKTSEFYDLERDGKGYYVTSDQTGNRVYVSNDTTKVNKSYATFSLRVYGKKAGKATVKFDIYDINGKKTGSAKITVISSKSRPIDSITFAGKSLISSEIVGAADKNYIYSGVNSKINQGHLYTTKKSGKLKVKENSNYKLVRIQVGTLEKYKWSNSKDPRYGESNYSTADRKYTDTSSGETTGSHPVDLNGDGDYDDTINGVSEKYVTFRYKTVKNNKKIKLSKTPYYSKSTSTYSQTYTNNKSENYSSSSESDDNSAFTAPTEIRVTLYSRITKEYVDQEFTIYKKR